MRYAQLVHPLMNRLACLEEGTFEVGGVVFLTVMMCGRTLLVQRGSLADVGETTVNEREHILRRVFVEHPPLTTAGDVNRRCVRKYSTPPTVMVRNARVIGPAASRRHPCMPIHPHLCRQ